MAKRKKICVIGLGYVGLPLAVLCSLKGYEVTGFDNDRTKIKKINSGLSPIKEKFLEENLPKAKVKATTDAKIIKRSDIILVCVPTPVDEKFYPNLAPLKKAVNSIVRNFKKGQLIIIESTINPGVCEEIIEPLFAEAGYKVGKDYYLAHCPERINPGDPKWNVANIPRVIGSFDNKGLKRAKKFYESIIDASIRPMNSIREAEAVKIMENSFRDINIAFVNELAKSFDRMNIDIVDVIKGAATKPFAFMPHWPSRGVGGHCIPVDPYYLIEKAKDYEFDHKFLRTARNINNSMPAYTVELLQDMLNRIEKPMKNASIGVMGVSYKADVGDLRQSPAIKIIELLQKHEVKLYIYDPYLPEYSNVESTSELLKKSGAVILVTNHSEFVKIPPENFKKNRIKVIVDGMNCLDKEKIKKLGIAYKGIGR